MSVLQKYTTTQKAKFATITIYKGLKTLVDLSIYPFQFLTNSIIDLLAHDEILIHEQKAQIENQKKEAELEKQRESTKLKQMQKNLDTIYKAAEAKRKSNPGKKTTKILTKNSPEVISILKAKAGKKGGRPSIKKSK